MKRFNASVKKYDPDEEQEDAFETLASAAKWCRAQEAYGFSSGWITDKESGVRKRFWKITKSEIRRNGLAHEGS